MAVRSTPATDLQFWALAVLTAYLLLALTKQQPNIARMTTDLGTTIRAALFAVALTWSQSAFPEAPIMKNGSIKILGREYYFPEFVRTDPGEHIFISYFYGGGAEVSMNAKFWNGLYEGLAELKGWQITRDTYPRVVNIRPVDNALYFWPKPRAQGMPPVREPVALETSNEAYKVWKSLDPENASHPLYITYAGREDFYVICDNDALHRASSACEINWNDQGLIHSFFVPGNLFALAPEVLDRYVRIARGTSFEVSK